MFLFLCFYLLVFTPLTLFLFHSSYMSFRSTIFLQLFSLTPGARKQKLGRWIKLEKMSYSIWQQFIFSWIKEYFKETFAILTLFLIFYSNSCKKNILRRTVFLCKIENWYKFSLNIWKIELFSISFFVKNHEKRKCWISPGPWQTFQKTICNSFDCNTFNIPFIPNHYCSVHYSYKVI